MTYEKECANSDCCRKFTCNNECGGNFVAVVRGCYCSVCINKDLGIAKLYATSTINKDDADLKKCYQFSYKCKEKVVFT